MTDVSKFSWEPEGNGIKLSLTKEKKRLLGKSTLDSVPIDKWGQEKLHAVSGLARLELGSAEEESGITIIDGGYHLAFDALSRLSESQALSLDLPANVPFELRLDLSGPIEKPETVVRIGWYKKGAKKISVRELGSILTANGTYYRIAYPVYKLIKAVDDFNDWNGEILDERLARLSRLQLAVEFVTGERVIDLDKQLSSMRLLHASTVSLNISVNRDGVNFTPVLFSQEKVEQSRSAGTIVEEADQLLPERFRASFNKQFYHGDDIKPTYVVERNQYVFIDPSLRETMRVVKRAQKADAQTRARFAKSPQSFIKAELQSDALDDETIDEIVDSAFVETDRFSERVLEVGLWTPPALPFIKREKNTWFPEHLGVKVGTESYIIPESELQSVAERVRDAIQEGNTQIPLNEEQNLPANTEVLEALNRLLTEVAKKPPVPDTPEIPAAPELEPDEPDEPEPPLGKSVLQVQDNLEADGFTIKFKPRTEFAGYHPPYGLKNHPKNHQIAGVEWLQNCWSNGYPGVLLADDMGLGKTFQALAFISWLQEKRQKLGMQSRPVLIIAPTTLLGSWQAEAELHLDSDAIGDICLLYGTHLKQYKRDNSSGNDVTSGEQTLEHARISKAQWILTTYETMRDYHISIASIPFACIVFDEMQKIKSPQSMMTHAAQALNADFKIGLTGTPIENSLADIWTLFDTLIPGALGLGNLKSFISAYRIDDPDRLKELKARLTEEIDGNPPVMLRRLKSEVANDLPDKVETVFDQTMPDLQAKEYLNALNIAQSEAKGKQLQAMQRIRGVSLHPYAPDSEDAVTADTYISHSARLKLCFDLLDKVHVANEKALIFIESRSMHEWLTYAIKQRYGLPKFPERIFGSVSPSKRTQIVNAFQDPEKKGLFDVLLLSPKAAGVGLTLTAATHVIHLSRWWNPAVEDQCTDRAYRIGQTHDVHVYILRAIHPLYATTSFDCILHDLLESKRSLSKEMLMPMENGSELDAMLKGMTGQWDRETN